MNKNLRNIAISGLMIALGIVLPFFTGQIPKLGSMLLPMHLPVFICALVCGGKYGFFVGAVFPLLRSSLFMMPPMYPVAMAMALEMATYGLVAGLVYFSLRKMNSIVSVYVSLLVSMVAGRILWGIAMFVLLRVKELHFGFENFMTGAIFMAIPGIVLQLILVPLIVFTLEKAGISSKENE